MLKIRLMRIGAKKKPFYRVVAVDERAKRTGAYLELLGTYNPLTEPKDINLKKDRIEYWVKQGAQASTGFLRITGKAPQRPPRKPKKQKAETPQQEKPQEQKETEEVKTEQNTQEEAKPEEAEVKETSDVKTDDTVNNPQEQTTPQEEEPNKKDEGSA